MSSPAVEARFPLLLWAENEICIKSSQITTFRRPFSLVCNGFCSFVSEFWRVDGDSRLGQIKACLEILFLQIFVLQQQLFVRNCSNDEDHLLRMGGTTFMKHTLERKGLRFVSKTAIQRCVFSVRATQLLLLQEVKTDRAQGHQLKTTPVLDPHSPDYVTERALSMAPVTKQRLWKQQPPPQERTGWHLRSHK